MLMESLELSFLMLRYFDWLKSLELWLLNLKWLNLKWFKKWFKKWWSRFKDWMFRYWGEFKFP